MGECPQSNRPSRTALDSTPALSAPDAGGKLQSASASELPAMPDIEREAGEAMAALVPDDSYVKHDEVISSDSVAPGTELTATVVGVSGDDVFVEFNAKSRANTGRIRHTTSHRLSGVPAVESQVSERLC